MLRRLGPWLLVLSLALGACSDEDEDVKPVEKVRSSC